MVNCRIGCEMISGLLNLPAGVRHSRDWMTRLGLITIFGLLLSLAAGVCARAASKARVDFNREIQPILSDNCFACHGPDEKERKVDLRLDTQEGIFADRGGYRVIVPGNSAASRLFQRISAENRLVRMPPAAAHRTLPKAQGDLI